MEYFLALKPPNISLNPPTMASPTPPLPTTTTIASEGICRTNRIPLSHDSNSPFLRPLRLMQKPVKTCAKMPRRSRSRRGALVLYRTEFERSRIFKAYGGIPGVEMINVENFVPEKHKGRKWFLYEGSYEKIKGCLLPQWLSPKITLKKLALVEAHRVKAKERKLEAKRSVVQKSSRNNINKEHRDSNSKENRHTLTRRTTQDVAWFTVDGLYLQCRTNRSCDVRKLVIT
ncbi:hypothetical protein GIB67_001836 [Kingdonia uniflora]|uniref:Uncharacterized protein n=1 Tax=Kingdonia uniflora TaxID=39325 RepID=A0A7J7LBU5_9MAGN|nr:hypothetical protein GIB67_001836 [Kingdonia uniflora]